MVRGVIQGKYIPLFGRDSAAELILAMTSGLEGRAGMTESAFDNLIKRLNKPIKDPVIPADLLIYSTYYNSAAHAEHIGNKIRAAELWNQLASYARAQGKAILFQLAVRHVTQRAAVSNSPDSAPNIEGIRLGDKFSLQQDKTQSKQVSDLWVEGEQYKVYRFQNGRRYVIDPGRKVVNAWQDAGQEKLNKGIAMGDTADRALKTLGIPDRQLHMLSGEYLAYDTYGLAVHVVQDRVAGWFLYHP